MSPSRTIELFAKRPISTAVLALVVVVLGFVFIGSLIPPTSGYRYLPGHEWTMAVVCWAFALFLAWCSYLGFRRKPAGK